MGPFQLIDNNGADIVQRAMESVYEGFYQELIKTVEVPRCGGFFLAALIALHCRQRRCRPIMVPTDCARAS